MNKPPSSDTEATEKEVPAAIAAVDSLTRHYLDLQLSAPAASLAARADFAHGGPRLASIGSSSGKSAAPLGLVIAAFAAIYTIWGSTYFAIRLAIGTIPPFLMAGVRFLTAGLLLYAAMRLRAVPPPRRAEWRSALILGALLLFAGNGGVTWAEQRVPSSLAALMIATVPLWMILLDWARPGGPRPRLAVGAGLLIGFAGVALIVASKDHAGRNVVEPLGTVFLLEPLGTVFLLGAALCWAIGSLYSRQASQAAHPLMAIAAQMICGGALMLATGFALGETRGFHPANVSAASAWALVYLVFVGALIGFTAYVWLLQVSTPAKVSTYAYVNPLIAVLLGWSMGHEPITGTILLAGALIVGAVVLITTSRQRAIAVTTAPGASTGSSSTKPA